MKLCFAIIVATCLAGTSCASVKPWQRGRLVKRCMLNELDPLETAFNSHVHNTREAMQGAASGGGASCGCN